MTLDDLSHALTHAFPFVTLNVDRALDPNGTHHIDIVGNAGDQWIVVEWSPLREGFGLSLLDVATLHTLYPSPDHHVETLEQLINQVNALLTKGQAA